MDITEKSNITLEFDKIREELAKYARFKQSKQLCLNLLPQSEPQKIQEQILYTKEAKKILDYAKETPVEEKMIVIASNDMKIILLVDEIGNLLNIAPEKFHSQNDLNLNKMFIKSEIYIDNKVYNILDMQRLLNDERIFIGKDSN